MLLINSCPLSLILCFFAPPRKPSQGLFSSTAGHHRRKAERATLNRAAGIPNGGEDYFNTSAIRVVTIDGNPWFVAGDVCRAMGTTNPSQTVKPLDASERGLYNIDTPSGYRQSVLIVSESGLYKLALKAEAKGKPWLADFQNLVTKEVLPSIRKTGAFVTGQPTALLSHDFNGHTFLFREDGYINMTKAAKAFGKQLNNFWKSPETKEYMKALADLSGSTFKSNDLKQALPGNRYVPGAGTYGHPKLAVFFARWLDVRFAVWCDLMTQGSY